MALAKELNFTYINGPSGKESIEVCDRQVSCLKAKTECCSCLDSKFTNKKESKQILTEV